MQWKYFVIVYRDIKTVLLRTISFKHNSIWKTASRIRGFPRCDVNQRSSFSGRGIFIIPNRKRKL